MCTMFRGACNDFAVLMLICVNVDISISNSLFIQMEGNKFCNETLHKQHVL